MVHNAIFFVSSNLSLVYLPEAVSSCLCYSSSCITLCDLKFSVLLSYYILIVVVLVRSNIAILVTVCNICFA